MSLSDRTILLVDDEEGQRDLMHRILRLEAYTVLQASDYDYALRVQKRHLGEIDLLLVDISLPGRNGYDLAKAMLAVEPHLKVLFVSGYAGAELCKYFEVPLTEVHFLQKPFGPAELLERVKAVLELADTSANGASAY